MPNLKPRDLWLITSLVFVFFWSLPNLSHPIGRDQALYCVIAQGVLDGQRPYLDLWDNRPPTTFLVFVPIVKVLGNVMWSVGAVDILWLLCISYFIFLFAERYLGLGPAVLAVSVNAVWHCAAGYTHALVPSTIVIFCMFVGLVLVWNEGRWTRVRHFGAGLMLGAAFWATFNALVLAPLLLFLPYLDFREIDQQPRRVTWAICGRSWLPRAAALTLGFLAVLVGMIAYLRLVGSWQSFREINFEAMPIYARLPLERTEGYWLRAIKETEYVVGQLTLVVLLAAILIARKQRELYRLAPVLLAAALGFFSAAIQVRFHAYYFETSYPFFAMAWGYMGAKALESFRALARHARAKGWRVASILVWVLLADVLAWFAVDLFWSGYPRYKALGLWWHRPERLYAAYPWSHTLEHLKGELGVVRYLKVNSSPSDRLFIWGTQPLIYFLSERRPATRFISNLGLISPWGLRSWRAELVRDLREAPPLYLVVVRKDAIPSVSYTSDDSEKILTAFPELAAVIADSYQKVETVENFVIYRRAASPPWKATVSVRGAAGGETWRRAGLRFTRAADASQQSPGKGIPMIGFRSLGSRRGTNHRDA